MMNSLSPAYFIILILARDQLAALHVYHCGATILRRELDVALDGPIPTATANNLIK
jgi:hypothetical protein